MPEDDQERERRAIELAEKRAHESATIDAHLARHDSHGGRRHRCDPLGPRGIGRIRLVMTKVRAGALAAFILVALTLLNTYFILQGHDENQKRLNETHALAVQNCETVAALARIERDFIARQEAQSRALLASGVTLGIPPAQLAKLGGLDETIGESGLSDLGGVMHEQGSP